MIRLYRKQGGVPADWLAAVTKSLHTSYFQEAANFEALALNSAERRAGFAQFAAHVLIVRSGKVGFPSLWTKFKHHLFALSHSKCSYCEGEINSDRAAHVEHFQPKSLFPLLAYKWTNYFLACAGCNGAKGDKWPVKGGYVRPDRGDPTRLFRFETDGAIHPARRSAAAKRTIEAFALSRKPLVKRRKIVIDVLLGELAFAEEISRENPDIARRLAAKILARITAPDCVYSAALTNCFRSAWPAVRVPPKPSKQR